MALESPHNPIPTTEDSDSIARFVWLTASPSSWFMEMFLTVSKSTTDATIQPAFDLSTYGWETKLPTSETHGRKDEDTSQ